MTSQGVCGRASCGISFRLIVAVVSELSVCRDWTVPESFFQRALSSVTMARFPSRMFRAAGAPNVATTTRSDIRRAFFVEGAWAEYLSHVSPAPSVASRRMLMTTVFPCCFFYRLGFSCFRFRLFFRRLFNFCGFRFRF